MLRDDEEEVLLPVGTDGSCSGIEISLVVQGMTCAECGDRIQHAMEILPGIFECDTKFLSAAFRARYDPLILTPEKIIQQITTLGFSAQLDSSAFGSDLSELEVLISCRRPIAAAEIEDLVQDDQVAAMIESLVPTQASPTTVIMKITLAAKSDAREFYDQLTSLLAQEGLEVSLLDPRAQARPANDASRWTHRLIASAILTLPIVTLAFVSLPDSLAHLLLCNVPVRIWFEFLLAIPIQFVIALPLYASAYRTLRYSKEVEMDFLIVSSTSIAFGYSVVMMACSALQLLSGTPWDVEYFYDTTAILITLIIFGRWMEKRVAQQTTTTLTALTELQASTALLFEEANPAGRTIDVRLCRHGDILRVLPGVKIPLDGVVVSGSSEVDESMLSGEAFPILKSSGDTVHGGSINQSSGSLLIRVTHTTREGTLAQMHKLIEMSQSSRPTLQRFVDRIAAYFVRIILVLALLCFSVWYGLAVQGVIDTSSPFAFALRFAITVMIISCPCALVLASPTAVMVASGVAAEHGIIFKSGSAIETLSKLTMFLFDKTGTLTTGHMSVRSLSVSDVLKEHWIFARPVISFFVAPQKECSSSNTPPLSNNACCSPTPMSSRDAQPIDTCCSPKSSGTDCATASLKTTCCSGKPQSSAASPSDLGTPPKSASCWSDSPSSACASKALTSLSTGCARNSPAPVPELPNEAPSNPQTDDIFASFMTAMSDIPSATEPRASCSTSVTAQDSGCCSASLPGSASVSPSKTLADDDDSFASFAAAISPSIGCKASKSNSSSLTAVLPPDSDCCSTTSHRDSEHPYRRLSIPTPAEPTDFMLSLVHLVEAQSQHPIARALLAHTAAAADNCPGLKQLQLDRFVSVAGFGVTGVVKTLSDDGSTIVDLSISIGSWDYMQQCGVHPRASVAFWSSQEQQIINEQEQGNVVFYFGLDSSLVGLVVVSDVLKAEAINIVNHLQHARTPTSGGLAVGILSGDASRTVNAVATQLSPHSPLIVYPELSPSQKSVIVREAQDEGNVVGFIGDGINDAAALSQANVGFSLADGTDLAMSTADVLLLKNDLRDVAVAIDLARLTMKIIKLNIWWGILYNIVAMPIALGVLWPIGFAIPPAVAGFAELFSSIPVILFSLLIKRYQAPTL